MQFDFFICLKLYLTNILQNAKTHFYNYKENRQPFLFKGFWIKETIKVLY